MSDWMEKRPSGASQIAGDGRFFASFGGPQNGSLVNCGRASRRNMTESQWQKALTSQALPEKKGPDETTFVVCFQATPTHTPTQTQTPTPTPTTSGGASCLPVPGHVQAHGRHPPMPHAMRRQSSDRLSRHVSIMIFTLLPCAGFPARASMAACRGEPPRQNTCLPAGDCRHGRPPPAKSGQRACGPESVHGQHMRRHGRPAMPRHGGTDSVMRLRAIAAVSGPSCSCRRWGCPDMPPACTHARPLFSCRACRRPENAAWPHP